MHEDIKKYIKWVKLKREKYVVKVQIKLNLKVQWMNEFDNGKGFMKEVESNGDSRKNLSKWCNIILETNIIIKVFESKHIKFPWNIQGF